MTEVPEDEPVKETVKKEEKPAQKPQTAIQVFENQLYSYKSNMRDLLAAHNMSELEFMVTAINAIKKTPNLLDADRKTLFGAILMSAELGLPPNTPMQLSFILPYKRKFKNEKGNWDQVTEAQFQIGYQGWVEIMLRNPKIESIDSGNVFSNEKWHFNKGLREPFSHEPKPPSTRGDYVGSYAIAWMTTGNKPKVIFLYKEEIEEFKKISQGASSDYSPWNSIEKDPQKWMYRKTVLKQLSKELPKTRDMAKAYAQDTVVELGGTQKVDEAGKVELIESDYQKFQHANDRKDAKDEKVNQGMQDGLFGKETQAKAPAQKQTDAPKK